MAKSSASAGMLWACVILGFLFVISATLAVLFGTKLGALQAQADKAGADLRQYVAPAEASQPSVVALLGQDGTVVGQLLAANQELKRSLSGGADDSLPLIKQRMGELGIESGGTAFQTIRQLRDEISDRDAQIAQLNQQREQAETRARDAETARAQLETEFNRAKNQLQARIDTIQQDLQGYQQQVETQRRTLENTLATTRQQLQGVVQIKQGEVDQAQSRIRQLEAQVADLTPTGGRVTGDVDLSQVADGRVASLLPEQRLVYLNVGRNDQLMTGITFEVYDERAGIVPDESGNYQGKATVEVINVHDDFSVARVVQGEFDQINENDIIGNVVWDPHQQYTFYVYGEFDIDGIGQSTVTDRRRIENMIRQWNGKVASRQSAGSDGSRLSYNIDFLVLGQAPPRPTPLAPGEVDVVKIEAYQRQLREFETYEDLKAEARALSIPVLDQNRFLALVGYHSR